jgi:RNA-binding protein
MTTPSQQDLKQYRAIAHNLNPVVIIGDKGLNEGMLKELERALSDHELIKVKINVGEREDRKQLTEEITRHCQAELIQAIGKVIVLLRRSGKPNPKLSNLIRHAG